MPGLGAAAVATPLRQPTLVRRDILERAQHRLFDAALDEKMAFKGRSQHRFGNLAARINP